MNTYSIRRIYLKNKELMSAELATKNANQFEEFEKLCHQHACVLKVINRSGKFEPEILSNISSRKMHFWLKDAHSLYLFTSVPELREWSRTQRYLSTAEEDFLTDMRVYLLNSAKTKFEMVSENYIFQFGGPTRVMGILNVTPDSFFGSGETPDKQRAIEHGLQMERDGADIIDVGGESTRPGATPISEAEELERVTPVIEGLISDLRVPVSIDTYKSHVAEAAIQAGATIVNDISGLQFDPSMMDIVKHYDVPIILMHINGTPKDMQINPNYENLMDEIYTYFEDRIAAVEQAGISRDRVILDPGIGFGKRLWDNYEILQRLEEFSGLGCPLMVGPSRKTFIGKALDLPPEERLEGTAAAVTASVLGGSHIVRVHDVKEMLRVVQIADLIAGTIVIREQE